MVENEVAMWHDDHAVGLVTSGEDQIGRREERRLAVYASRVAYRQPVEVEPVDDRKRRTRETGELAGDVL
ncbi:MAG: hypothetical protein EA416_04910 [Trueperaceae bacterium]|nr:MAG: hypothetical protein EA416_04910 [Trueperaceae bacterium]